MTEKSLTILMIHPKFNAASFWNYAASCELVGAKYPASPLPLITVAAMLPQHWDIRLVDRNVEDLRPEAYDGVDYVFLGGMLPQQLDLLGLIAECRARGIPTVVGGPDVSSSPEVYASADIRVIGEFEGVVGEVIAALSAGRRSGVFEAEKFTADVTTTPIPRFDLLTFKNYFNIGVQFSRGCPFNCEFCDIIELYGRKPRTKTKDQMLAELERLYALGYRGHVDFVDDNLIGNKKAVKAFLPHLIAWQKAKGYPFEFSTEASLNLSDDPELLMLMRDAGFFAVFVGIESPDPKLLVAMQKKQNTRRDIAKSVHRIYEAGIFVTAGFIVGFDNESDAVAAEISALIEEAAIPVAMVGLLYALPNTQLTKRLAREGRLHPDHDVVYTDAGADQCTAGLNYDTTRPRAEILADYRQIVDATYDADRYFGRLRRVGAMLKTGGPGGQVRLSSAVNDLRHFALMAARITWRRPDLRRHFWSVLIRTLLTNPGAIKQVMMMTALYAHLGQFSRYVSGEITRQIDDQLSGRWQRPVAPLGAGATGAAPLAVAKTA